MKKFSYFVIISFVAVLTFFACSKDELSILPKENVIVPQESMVKSLFQSSILQHDDYVSTIDTKVKTWETNEGLLNDTFLEKNIDELIVQNVIYFSEKEAIKGIGIYYFSKKKKNYFFDFFKYDLSINNFRKEFSYLSSTITLRELLFFGKKNFNNADVDLFIIKDVKKFNVSDDYSDFLLNLKTQSIKTNTKSGKVSLGELSRGISDAYVVCGHVGNCISQIGDACQSPSFTCVENTGCGAQQLRTRLKDSNIPNSHYYLANVLLDNKYYALRNRFLDKSWLGQEYIGMYYATNQHFMQSLDAGTTLDIVKVLPEINKSIDKLINLNSNDIIVSKSLQKKILKITLKLKNNSSSNKFKLIITKFESDLLKISGKTRVQINEYFEL